MWVFFFSILLVHLSIVVLSILGYLYLKEQKNLTKELKKKNQKILQYSVDSLMYLQVEFV